MNVIFSVVHSPTLMKKSGAWEGCWSQFHDAIVKGKLDACRQLLTSDRCITPMCLGALSPAYRLRQLDSIAFSKLRTTALHMATLYRRPDFVQLLLEQGSEATVMDGFGRTPAAVLLEHWPRVTMPSSHSSPPWDQHLSPRPAPRQRHTPAALGGAGRRHPARVSGTCGGQRPRDAAVQGTSHRVARQVRPLSQTSPQTRVVRQRCRRSQEGVHASAHSCEIRPGGRY
ncbi:hypothetical protein ACOMHN_064516 [Nucella lapillus]